MSEFEIEKHSVMPSPTFGGYEQNYPEENSLNERWKPSLIDLYKIELDGKKQEKVKKISDF